MMKKYSDVLTTISLSSVVNSQLNLIRNYLLKLNQQLQADFLFIAENNKGSTQASSLLTLSKQQVVENFSYDLPCSPCEQAFANKTCFFPKNVSKLFPQDKLLTIMEIEGYLGLPLMAKDNQTAGIMVALFKREVENTELFSWSFEVFANHLSTLIQNACINEQIMLQNQLLKNMSQSANIGFWELDKGSLRLSWSPHVYKMFELEQDKRKILLSTAIEWFYPADRAKAKQFFEKALKNSKTEKVQLRFKSKSGKLRTALCRVSEGIETGRINGFIQDITDIHTMSKELHSSQQQLYEKEKLLQDIMDCSPAVIYVKGIDGKYLFINNKFTQTLGVTREQVIHKTDLAFLSEQDAHAFMENDRKVIESRTHMEVEEEVTQPDGKKLYVSEKFPLTDSHGEVYALCGISTDITQRRNQEIQLRQSQKMEAIGQLAGGIAHDFNNQLASIMGFAELIDASDDPVKIKNYVKKVILSAENSSELTKRLLSFSRKDETSEEQIDLHQLIYETKELLNHTLNKKNQIQIQTNLQHGSVYVLGNKSSLQNALLNLGLNARDAMPEGGEITISTQREERPGDLFFPNTISASGERPLVELIFSDTGIGISEQAIGRIFEPFFTTKKMGKGTGMGLALVYGIIEAMGGFISVESQPGQGTLFHLYFPISDHKEAVQEVSSITKENHETTTKTILLVDDEPAIRNLCSEFFQLLGYRGIFAADGAEAVLLYKKHRNEIDLVIMDMVMPNMNGEQAFFELKKIDPDVNVLLASGYTADFSVEHLISEGARKIIHKPFKLAEFKSFIGEIIQ